MGIKLNQFRADLPSCRYIFRNGKVAEFVDHWYRTNSEEEVAELTKEIKLGIGSIYVVPGQEIIDIDDLDPVAVLRRKIIAEYEAEKVRSLDNGNQVSDTIVKKAAGTNVAGVTAASSLSGGNAKVVPAGSIKIGKL